MPSSSQSSHTVVCRRPPAARRHGGHAAWCPYPYPYLPYCSQAERFKCTLRRYNTACPVLYLYDFIIYSVAVKCIRCTRRCYCCCLLSRRVATECIFGASNPATSSRTTRGRTQTPGPDCCWLLLLHASAICFGKILKSFVYDSVAGNLSVSSSSVSSQQLGCGGGGTLLPICVSLSRTAAAASSAKTECNGFTV